MTTYLHLWEKKILGTDIEEAALRTGEVFKVTIKIFTEGGLWGKKNIKKLISSNLDSTLFGYQNTVCQTNFKNWKN